MYSKEELAKTIIFSVVFTAFAFTFVAYILYHSYQLPISPIINSLTLDIDGNVVTPTPEILDINTSSICYGTFDFASGTIVDDCTETYEIASESLFIITDGYSTKMVAHGPLKIEVYQYIDFEKPVCLKDFEGFEYRFEGENMTISNEPLCD